MTTHIEEAEQHPPAVDPRTVAVIDVGTTSIRMAVAEIRGAGEVRTLETLSQAVSLGKDTFTRGSIGRETIEGCVKALSSYRRVLDEYRIPTDEVRIVATSAVREAQNRLAFVDRVFSATGFEIEPIDEAEVNRITYVGMLPYLKSEPALQNARTIVIEVGGGSTEVLLLDGDDVLFSHSYRLGSLRMRETLHAYRAPSARLRTLVSSQIERTIAQVVDHLVDQVVPDGNVELVALGGDVRFAASQIIPDWSPEQVGRIDLQELDRFTEGMLEQTEEELVQKYHLTFPDAETLSPALLAYQRLAAALRLDHLLVTNVNLRDGLLKEMAAPRLWTEEFAEQIVRSAVDLGRRYDFDEPHARHVAALAVKLFDELQEEHQLEPRYRLVLHVAALLHEIGMFVGIVGHHKHSYYLIVNSELFGLGRQDVLLVGLVARYHRRASPKPQHPGFSTLDRERRIAVSKMAALLRVADALERSHSQRIQDVHCHREDDRLIVSVSNVEDLSLEQVALRQKGSLFEEIFGLQVLLRRARV